MRTETSDNAKKLLCWKDCKYSCAADGCMAWEWVTKIEDIELPTGEVPEDDWMEIGTAFLNKQKWHRYVNTDKGYCDALPKETGCFYQG